MCVTCDYYCIMPYIVRTVVHTICYVVYICYVASIRMCMFCFKVSSPVRAVVLTVACCTDGGSVITIVCTPQGRRSNRLRHAHATLYILHADDAFDVSLLLNDVGFI